MLDPLESCIGFISDQTPKKNKNIKKDSNDNDENRNKYE